jgi:hypothetical protein
VPGLQRLAAGLAERLGDVLSGGAADVELARHIDR